jgi:hypothetical protein
MGALAAIPAAVGSIFGTTAAGVGFGSAVPAMAGSLIGPGTAASTLSPGMASLMPSLSLGATETAAGGLSPGMAALAPSMEGSLVGQVPASMSQSYLNALTTLPTLPTTPQNKAEPNPLTSNINSAGQAAKSIRELMAARRGSAQTPDVRMNPGAAQAVKLGLPIARAVGPLQAYAAMLRR